MQRTIVLLFLTCLVVAIQVRAAAAQSQEDNAVGVQANGYAYFESTRVWNNVERSDAPALQLLYRKPGQNPSVFLVTLDGDRTHVFQELTAGEYVLVRAYVGFDELDVPPAKMRIWPGVVTYVGTFDAQAAYPATGSRGQSAVTVVLDSQHAPQRFRQQYPDIAVGRPIYSDIITWRATN